MRGQGVKIGDLRDDAMEGGNQQLSFEILQDGPKLKNNISGST
jgi:hypothetical protein